MRPRIARPRHSIASKLILWFLVISLVPCAILAFVTYRLSERALEDGIRHTLLMAADAKEKQIEAYAIERIRSMSALSRTVTMVAACSDLAAARKDESGGSYRRTEQIHRPVLTYVTEAYDYTGLGETGEIVVSSRVDNDAVIVNPLRHDASAAFLRRVPIGLAGGNLLQRAVQGERGYGSAVDYRGVPVRAAWMYVPSFRWG